VSILKEDVLKLKAAVEFGSEYIYTIKNGGLGLTLVVEAETREDARSARKKIPGNWEGLYVIVIYSTSIEEVEWDPELSGNVDVS